MRRFFFHVQMIDGQIVHDPTGLDFPDIAAAEADAIQGVRQLLAETREGGDALSVAALQITDERGEVLTMIPFEEGTLH
jgi:hypothetical protein